MSTRHLWNPVWQSTYCGVDSDVRTTTLLLVTCKDCFRNQEDVTRLSTEGSLTIEQMFEET